MKNQNIIIAIAVVLIAASFYGGMQYGKSSVASSNSATRAGFNGQFGQGGGQRNGAVGANGARNMRNGGGLINGEVISKDDTGMTVKLNDGSSKIIFIASSTSVGKFVEGVKNDLTVGENVMVTGTANSDGSVVAQSIQIRPKGMEQSGAPVRATSTKQ